jgi:hypothetical protein
MPGKKIEDGDFMNEKQIANVIKHFSWVGSDATEGFMVKRVPDWKSVFVETIDGIGRSIMMSEYKVDGKIYWAGFSTRSQTIYVSYR